MLMKETPQLFTISLHQPEDLGCRALFKLWDRSELYCVLCVSKCAVVLSTSMVCIFCQEEPECSGGHCILGHRVRAVTRWAVTARTEKLPFPGFQTKPICVSNRVEKTSDAWYCSDRAITMYCVWSAFNSSSCFLTAKTCLEIAVDSEGGFFFICKACYIKSDHVTNSPYVMQDFSQEVFWNNLFVCMLRPE